MKLEPEIARRMAMVIDNLSTPSSSAASSTSSLSTRSSFYDDENDDRLNDIIEEILNKYAEESTKKDVFQFLKKQFKNHKCPSLDKFLEVLEMSDLNEKHVALFGIGVGLGKLVSSYIYREEFSNIYDRLDAISVKIQRDRQWFREQHPHINYPSQEEADEFIEVVQELPPISQRDHPIYDLDDMDE